MSVKESDTGLKGRGRLLTGIVEEVFVVGPGNVKETGTEIEIVTVTVKGTGIVLRETVDVQGAVIETGSTVLVGEDHYEIC